MSLMIPAWVDDRLQPVEKLAVHRRGLRHKAVSVFVTHERDVLLQRRARGKYHTPGLWTNTCCTHPHWGEAPLDCALRRLQEEMGIGGVPLRHRQRLEYRADVGFGLVEHELVDVYLGRASMRPSPDPDPAEVMDTRWLDIDALQADIQINADRYTPWMKIYLTHFAADIFGEVVVT